jgi:hypothetical protein
VRTRIVVGSAIAAGSWYSFYRLTTWRQRWGADDADAAAALPGDDLVPSASSVDTRSIRIAAPPEAVWPWLAQMGFGRGGWYSYDQLDMKGRSSDVILPAYQHLEVGDTVPTDPGGGFAVRAIDPGRSLVLYADAELMARRGPGAAVGADAPGLAASGRLLETGMPPEFAVSWVFVLRPDGAAGTILTERVRAAFGPPTAGSRAIGPVLGLGVFLMVRKQMLGIRERAEANPTPPVSPPLAPRAQHGETVSA